LPKKDGIPPVNSLLLKVRYFIIGSWPIKLGIGPQKLLLFIIRYSNLLKLASYVILPSNLLLDISTCIRGKVKNSLGRVEVKLLFCKLRSFRLMSRPIEGGRWDVRLLLNSCKVLKVAVDRDIDCDVRMRYRESDR
jgi:hypothetical protein